MATQEKIYRICGYCHGEGNYKTTSPILPHDWITLLCPECFGAGKIHWGYLEKETLENGTIT